MSETPASIAPTAPTTSAASNTSTVPTPATVLPASAADPCALLADGLDRSRERFDHALDGVTLEQANARPASGPAPRIDSLTWLAWHTAREIDLQVSALAGAEPLWTGAGFSARFALPLPDGTEDWRHAPEQAALVRVNDIALLTDYLDAACALAHEYLDGLEAAALDEVVDRSWDPPVTRAARLVSIIDDAAQHSGQAVYARRLLGLEG